MTLANLLLYCLPALLSLLCFLTMITVDLRRDYERRARCQHGYDYEPGTKRKHLLWGLVAFVPFVNILMALIVAWFVLGDLLGAISDWGNEPVLGWREKDEADPELVAYVAAINDQARSGGI